MSQNRARLLQSSLAFSCALLLTLILHEFAHGLTARLFYGLHPTVYGLHEHDVASSHGAVGVIAAAGPVVSLLLGLLFLFVIHKRQRGQGFARYLTLWLGVLGVATFFGYLLTTPFFKDGDVYVTLKAMGINGAAYTYVAFALGVAGIIELARLAVPYFVRLATPEQPLRPQMLNLGLFAWLLGGLAVVILTIPAYPFMILATGFVAPLTGLFAARRNPALPYGEAGPGPRLSYVGVVLLVVLTVLEQTVLRHGVHL